MISPVNFQSASDGKGKKTCCKQKLIFFFFFEDKDVDFSLAFFLTFTEMSGKKWKKKSCFSFSFSVDLFEKKYFQKKDGKAKKCHFCFSLTDDVLDPFSYRTFFPLFQKTDCHPEKVEETEKLYFQFEIH